MKLKPIGDKVIVEYLEAEEKSRGGIILPDAAKEKPQQGKVVSVGTGKILKNGKVIPPPVKPGDRVFFGKYSGSEIKLDGRDYWIGSSDEILAIID